MPQSLNTRSMIKFYGTFEMIIHRCMKLITTWSNYDMKKGEILGKGIKNVGNIYLIGIAFLNLSLSACIRTWSPSCVPSGWVSFLYIAPIASKLVTLHFVVIYYVGLNINIPRYTWMWSLCCGLSSSYNNLHSSMNISIEAIFIACSYYLFPS